MVPRTFIIKLKRSSEHHWPISSGTSRETEAQSEEGLAPDPAWWRGKSTKLGIPRLGLSFSSASRASAALGRPFFSLGLISHGFGLELGHPGVPGWAGDREGKDTNCHRPGTHALGGSLKHFYLY